MARMRVVKPEIWTSEQFVECSPNARLLFIGLWNFCDDSGIHPLKPMRIKMQVFPADGFSKADMDSMIQELADAELIQVYTVDGAEYLMVTGFQKHQRIDQPTYKHPLPSGEVPQNIRRISDESSANVHPRKGKDRKGSGKDKDKPTAKRATALPADFKPSDRHSELTSELNTDDRVSIDLATEFKKFSDHHKSKGNTYKDWSAALNNWLRNAADFQKARKPAPSVSSGGAPQLQEWKP